MSSDDEQRTRDALAMINAVKDKPTLWNTSKRWTHKIPGLAYTAVIGAVIVSYTVWEVIGTSHHEGKTRVVASISAAPQVASAPAALVKVRVAAPEHTVADPAPASLADPVYAAQRQVQANQMLQNDLIQRMRETARVKHELITQEIQDGYKLAYMCAHTGGLSRVCTTRPEPATTQVGEK